MRFPIGLALLFPALFAACNLSLDGEDLAYFECDETVTVLSPEDETSLGFTAADILAVAEGEHSAPLFWQEGMVKTAPESGEGSLMVAVNYSGGEIRFVEAKPKYGEAEYGMCNSRIEIEAKVDVHTEGGALDESFIGTLTAQHRGVAILSHSLDLDAVEGSFEVTEVDPPGAEAKSIDLEIGIASFGIFGVFDGLIEHSQGEVVSAGFHQYATFPTNGLACDFPFEAPLPFDAAWEGHSALEALALLDGHSNLELQWGGDAQKADPPTPMTLQVEPAGTSACGRISPAEDSAPLRFSVSATMKSDDGRLDGAIELEAMSRVDGEGGLGELMIHNPGYLDDIVSLEEFEETFGVHGVDFGDYNGGGLSFNLTSSAENYFGAMTVLGATIHECSNEPGEPCQSADTLEITGGVWAPVGD